MSMAERDDIGVGLRLVDQFTSTLTQFKSKVISTANSSADKLRSIFSSTFGQMFGAMTAERLVLKGVQVAIDSIKMASEEIKLNVSTIEALKNAQSTVSFAQLTSELDVLKFKIATDDDAMKKLIATMTTASNGRIGTRWIVDMLPGMAGFVAQGKSMDEIAQAIIGSMNGMTRSAKNYGVIIREGASDMEVLDAWEKKLKSLEKAAYDTANTAAGSMAKAKIASDDLQKSLGKWLTQQGAEMLATYQQAWENFQWSKKDLGSVAKGAMEDDERQKRLKDEAERQRAEERKRLEEAQRIEDQKQKAIDDAKAQIELERQVLQNEQTLYQSNKALLEDRKKVLEAEKAESERQAQMGAGAATEGSRKTYERYMRRAGESYRKGDEEQGKKYEDIANNSLYGKSGPKGTKGGAAEQGIAEIDNQMSNLEQQFKSLAETLKKRIDELTKTVNDLQKELGK